MSSVSGIFSHVHILLYLVLKDRERKEEDREKKQKKKKERKGWEKRGGEGRENIESTHFSHFIDKKKAETERGEVPHPVASDSSYEAPVLSMLHISFLRGP